MKKKGFTLVELVVSISLISIVLVSMLVTLVNLRSVYTESNEDTDIRIYGSSLSRAINKDIKDNKGIKTVVCNSNRSCIITLNNDEERSLVLNAREEKNTDITKPTGERIQEITNRTTILYKNTIKTASLDDDEIITIKTVSSVINSTSLNGDILSETINFFHFTNLEYVKHNYTSYTIHEIIIGASDPKYSVRIYSGVAS